MNSDTTNNSNLSQKVLHFINNHHSLTEIELNISSIGKEGAIAISEALKYNHTITNINLGFNNIGKKEQQQ